MGILSIQSLQPAGLSGVEPWFGYILTNNTLAEVLETGYLTNAASLGYTFSDKESVLVYTTDRKNQLLNVSISGGQISLEEMFTGSSPTSGSVVYSPEVKVTAADLALGGQKVILTASSPTAQYRVITASTNASESIDFTGLGDRDITFTDGTSEYGKLRSGGLDEVTVVPCIYGNADSVGDGCIDLVGLPNALTEITQPGADIYAIYTGGTTDYDDGEFAITFVVTQVAE